jgi:hypothetical protein
MDSLPHSCGDIAGLLGYGLSADNISKWCKALMNVYKRMPRPGQDNGKPPFVIFDGF